jgi:hypothetical protein
VVLGQGAADDTAQVLQTALGALALAVGQTVPAIVEDLAPEVVDRLAPALLREVRFERDDSVQKILRGAMLRRNGRRVKRRSAAGSRIWAAESISRSRDLMISR